MSNSDPWIKNERRANLEKKERVPSSGYRYGTPVPVPFYQFQLIPIEILSPYKKRVASTLRVFPPQFAEIQPNVMHPKVDKIHFYLQLKGQEHEIRIDWRWHG